MAKKAGRPSDYTQDRVAIYGLCCPDTGKVRYIGKANDPDKRFAGHLRETRGNLPRGAWIKTLRDAGKAPGLLVLRWVAVGEWKKAERELIAEFRAAGPLLNVADGGDQPFCSLQTRADNGRNTAKAIHGDPVKRRVWEVKQLLGKALKDGYCSDYAKSLMRQAARNNPKLYGAWAAI